MSRRVRHVFPPAFPPLHLAVEYQRELQRLTVPMMLNAEAEIYRIYYNEIKRGIQTTDEIKPLSPEARSAKKKIDRLIRKLQKQEESAFAKIAPKLSYQFVNGIEGQTQRDVSSSLMGAGIVKTASFYFSPADLASNIDTNIDLIKSIPSKYFERIKKATAKAFATDRGEGALSLFNHLDRYREENEHYNAVNHRRIKFIADQETRKIYAQTHTEKIKQAGVGHAIWRHVAGALHPRERHLELDGRIIDLHNLPVTNKRGERLNAGEDFNCHCIYIPVIYS